MSRVLFILKRREDYNQDLHCYVGVSTGLFNSATFVKDMLTLHGIEAELKVVTDNNDIDREVTAYKPTHVVIEGLWVVPDKFDILHHLHPSVKWIVRVHSDVPFLAMEGISMGWLIDYLRRPDVWVAPNSQRMMMEFITYARESLGRKFDPTKVVYLPNYYPTDFKPSKPRRPLNGYLNVSCFGAIRPLKNHLLQATAALDFAVRSGLLLNFHINVGRIEGGGGPILHNLADMFRQLQPAGHRLIPHEWTSREIFLKLVSTMDVGMQVTFSETFNIVAADHVSQGVPVIGCADIPWLTSDVVANPVDGCDMVRALQFVFGHAPSAVHRDQMGLIAYDHLSVRAWLSFLSL